jgi:hypothetical protein
MILETIKDLLPGDLRKLLSRALGRDNLPRPRRYIPHGMTVEEFFQALNDASVKCVVLRWFDTLPRVEPGEDIDMLVADEDLPALAALLDNRSGSVPCDIYTVTGLTGTQYKRRPYFPKALAARTIDRRILQDGLFQVPCPQDHFDGLAYHAVYQKGPASGLPTSNAAVTPLATPEHDYAGVLAALRDQLGLDVAIDMESLDLHLAAQSYRPTSEDLRTLAKSNSWISSHVFG